MAHAQLSVVSMILGPVQTNCYLVGDPAGKTAVVIDPAWDGARVVREAVHLGWRITDIWLTHAHFDHFGGVADIADQVEPEPRVGLHPLDQPLWRLSGGAGWFGVDSFDPGPEPVIQFAQGMTMSLGELNFEVRHTPGHSPGHVVFYCAQAAAVFCGDLVFEGSVGRTDLPGGDWKLLLESVRSQLLTLPDDVILYPGHGNPTSVGRERRTNPFLME